MKRVYRSLGAVCAAAATLAGITYTGDAAALGRKEYVVVLMDRSGSMLGNAISSGTDVRSKWKEAVAQAISRVEGQRDDRDRRPSSDIYWEDPVYSPPPSSDFYPGGSHCYQVWTFEDAGYTVRFPTDGSWFCATAADGFTKDATKYATVINQINTLTAPASAAPATPLAHSLCAALTAVRDAASSDPLWDPGDPNQVQLRRSIIMQSDGLENSTPSGDQCYGTVSNTATFNPTLADTAHPGFYAWAGGLAVNSWERKVYNMAFLSDPAEPAFPWVNGGNQYWGLKPGWTFLEFYTTVYGFPEFAAIDQAELVTLNIDALFTYIQSASAAATPDVNPQLQSLFRNFSKHTKGRYQRIQYDATKASQLGTAHDPPADVSDDGCVNNADYSMITQKDVYGKRDSEGQIVKRADVTRDGWVNFKDRDLVLRTWGKKRSTFQGTCP